MFKRKIKIFIATLILICFAIPSTCFADENLETQVKKELKNYTGYYAVLVVDQPVNNKKYAVSSKGDPGHTFLMYGSHAKPTPPYGADFYRRYAGFYPIGSYSSKSDLLKAIDVKGDVSSTKDKKHKWDIARIYKLDKREYDKLKKYISRHDDDDYNIEDYNCTTFAVEALEYAGIDTDLKREVWKLPSSVNGIPASLIGTIRRWKGYYPGSLGEQLDDLNGDMTFKD